MKAERRHQLASNSLSRELEGLPGQLKRHANTVLTVVLVVLAIVLLVRWRTASSQQAQQNTLTELATARSYVEQLRQPGLAALASQRLANLRTLARQQADTAVSSILNNSSDPKLKAQALIARGDLYWQLANIPELPGAATQPSLRSPETSDELLQKSAGAYEEVLNNADYAKQTDAALSARFGLAAVDENRGNWDGARKQLDAIVKDTGTPKALLSQAQFQLSKLDENKTPLYLAPATEPATQPAATQPAH